MAAGKNKLLRYCRLYVNGGDLSGDSRTFSSAESIAESVDMTGWSSAQYRSYIVEQTVNVALRGYQAMLNDDTNQSFDLLKDAGGTGFEVSLLFGGGAAPVAGDPAYIMAAAQFSSSISIDESKPILTAEFLADSSVSAHYKPWGVVLLPSTALTSTTTGTTIDNLAATTSAYHAHLHILATSSGDYEFVIQHSTNGSDWSTLNTFTLNGSAIGSERLSGTGTVNRYRRIVATRTGGTCTAVCVLATE